MTKFLKRVGITLAVLLAVPASPTELKKLPAFRLHTLQGEALTYPNKEKEVVILNFFASWCTSCVEEIPILQKIREKYPSAKLFGIDVGEDATRAERWAKKYKYPWEVLLDTDSALTEKLGITAIPVTLIVDKQGRITYRGSRPPVDMDKELAKAGD